MTPPREWLKPPRSLLALLFLVTFVSVSALAWLGWKLLDQERAVEAQRAQERLEQAADRIAAIARGTLAETGERLGTWLIAPPADSKPDEGLLLILSGNDGGFTAMPAQRLLYRPAPPLQFDDSANVFAEGETMEFQQKLPDRAIEAYRKLAASGSPQIRAGALIRLARVLRKVHREQEARSVYQQLIGASANVGGVPAGLIARNELCELRDDKNCATQLRQDLLHARWPITRSQFAYYWTEASRVAGEFAAPSSAASDLAEAVQQGWSAIRGAQSPRGQTTVWVDDHPWFVIWRGVPSHRAALVIRPESLLKPLLGGGDVFVTAVDGEGRVVAGRWNGTAHAVVRTPAETQLPWTLYMTSAQGLSATGIIARQRFLLLAMAVMVLFLIAGAYFIARAIRGDLAVARMQSDFVSAVSHEFRSPLTSIRQLSELLALGRVPSEDRRRVYYETLVRETTRLQRLVEALLNFGRMEAGVRRYHFEPLDTAALVSRVAAEFEPRIAGSGRRIELDGSSGSCTIEADPEALSVALRNLVDNALKYAPDCPAVQVKWSVQDSQVAIRVRDRGPGIPDSEKRAIFRKFVRGSAAEAANVKGSGVGLAMVRHIVAAHGGDVTLESELGAGSEFTILLPAAQRAKAPLCASEPGEQQ